MILPVVSPSVITPSSFVRKIRLAGSLPVVDLISKVLMGNVLGANPIPNKGVLELPEVISVRAASPAGS